jgi:hypothetical protein
MVTQIEYEVFTLHHKQKLMQEAQTSRALIRMRKTNPKKNPGVSSIISWVRTFTFNKQLGSQVQSTSKAGKEKKLISG